MADTQRIVDLRQAGLTQQQIANEIGMSRSYVQKVLSQQREAPAQAESRPKPRRVKLTTAAVSSRAPVAASDKPVQVMPGAMFVEAEGSEVGAMVGQVKPLPDNAGEWVSFGLEGDTWRALGRQLTLPTLANIAPGISRAIWDYLRMLDPGHEIDVFIPGTEEPHEQGKELVDTFLKERVEPRYASLKGMFQQMYMGALYRGAFCAQLVTDEAVRTPLEIIIPDPIIIQFKSVRNEDTGIAEWVAGIIVKGNWTPVESPFFAYVGVDRMTGDPYGRSMIAPASFMSIFIMGLLYDLRRVVAQQGYPRTNITVHGALLRDAYLDLNEDEFREMLEGYVEDIAGDYATLQPDDAFVKSDVVTVDAAPGAAETGVIHGAVELIESLERMETRALKTMPLLMGITDNVHEESANRQWEIFAHGVKVLQHYAETVTQRLLTMALQIQGVQAEVRVRFAEVRTAEVLRDEQAAKAKMENAAFARDQGWISQEEASEYAVGHSPVGDQIEDTDEDAEVDTDEGIDAEESPAGPEAANAVRLRAMSRSGQVVTARSMDTAIGIWEETWGRRPEATMLRAPWVGVFEQIPDDAEDDWYWVEESRAFVYRKTEWVHSPGCRDILDEFQQRRTDAAADAIRDVPVGSRGWKRRVLNTSWEYIEPTLIAGAILGSGGIEGMTSDAQDRAAAEVREQRDFWDDFADETAEITVRRTRAKGEGIELGEDEFFALIEEHTDWYIDATGGVYEVSRAAAWGMVLEQRPPKHPHCRCYMEYGIDLIGPWATWYAYGGACRVCQELSNRYQHYRGT